MSEFSLNSENYKSYYSWEKFSGLSGSEREELIRFSVEQIRKEQGLQKVDVEFFKADSTSRGSCSQVFDGKRFAGHSLKLNNDVLTESDDFYAPYKTFNTINHELKHASQFELASNRHVKNSNPEALEQRLNDQHYYNANGDKQVLRGRMPRFDEETDYQMYRAQACEADARAAGLSAVEGLKANGQTDPYLDSYIKTQKAREINNNRVMMSKLGMHSREEMAKEELKYISTKKLKEPDRQRVLEYARQKDFETAREVLNADSRGAASEEDIKDRFNNDQGYANFYKTQRYNQNKVNESNHDYYIYAKHKWEYGENATESNEDSLDIEGISLDAKESVSLGQKLNDYFNSIADPAGYDPEVQTIAGMMGKGVYKAFEHSFGVSDPSGSVAESVAQFSRAAATFVIGGSQKMMERAYRQYETPAQKYLREHPLRSADGMPLTIEEGKQRAFESVATSPEETVTEEGDSAFFEGVDKQSSLISMEADQEFFEGQDSYSSLDNGEDQSFFDKIDQKSFKLGQKIDEKIEGAMQTAAKITQGQKK